VIRSIFLLFFFGACVAAVASDAIGIPAVTTVAVLNRVTIPITGSLDVPAGAVIRIDFEFTPSTFQPNAAQGSPAAALECPTIALTNVDARSKTDGSFSVECNQAQTVSNGVIATLEITGIPTLDREGSLRPTKLFVNNIERSSVLFQGGVIQVTEGGSQPQPLEGVSGNAPNPVLNRTNFEYSIVEPGLVRFFIRDVHGRLYAELPSETLSAGAHTKLFETDAWSISSGVYIFQLVTPTSSYNHTFMVQK